MITVEICLMNNSLKNYFYVQPPEPMKVTFESKTLKTELTISRGECPIFEERHDPISGVLNRGQDTVF